MKSISSRLVILLISMILIVLYFCYSWEWTLIASLIFGVLGILSSKFSQFVENIWNKISYYLGFLMTNILLTFIFFLVLTPLALISRIFNEDKLRLSKKYKTNFIERESIFSKEQFEKTW